MTTDELGINYIPRYTDFNIRFSNITKDGVALNFSGVSSWIFGMSTAITGTPIVLKASTGTATSGDFSLDYANRNVTVRVRASEISHGVGTHYLSLWANTSGMRISHDSMKYVTIFDTLCPTGLV